MITSDILLECSNLSDRQSRLSPRSVFSPRPLKCDDNLRHHEIHDARVESTTFHVNHRNGSRCFAVTSQVIIALSLLLLLLFPLLDGRSDPRSFLAPRSRPRSNKPVRPSVRPFRFKLPFRCLTIHSTRRPSRSRHRRSTAI